MSHAALNPAGPRGLWLALGVLGCLCAGGCQVYQLQGRVISGTDSHIEVVEANDPRLGQPGLADVMVKPVLDPASLDPKDIPAGYSRPDGDFAIPIDTLGAGVLEFELGVTCKIKGRVRLNETLPLPGRSKRLLIVLGAGMGNGGEPDDIIHDTIQRGHQLMDNH